MDDCFFWIMLGVGIGIGFLVAATLILSNENIISDSTLQEICQKLSGNETIEYEVSTEDGKLICEAPSYDNTQQIIFSKNNEVEHGY